jgi:hypothetical protein
MVRCYDCGKPIPDGQIIRRDVCTVSSGSYGGPRYYSRVSLCPACAAQRDYDPFREMIKWIIGWIMKSKIGRIIIYCFFAMILFLCIVSGIIHLCIKSGIIHVHETAKPKNNKIDQTQQIDSKLTTSQPRFKQGDRFHSSGTVTKVKTAYVRFSGTVALDITIMHSGVPGILTPGTGTFRAYAAPGGALNIQVSNIDNFDNAVGRKVDFVIEWHDQWILVELVGKKSK